MENCEASSLAVSPRKTVMRSDLPGARFTSTYISGRKSDLTKSEFICDCVSD
jgi:hypothetical protein